MLEHNEETIDRDVIISVIATVIIGSIVGFFTIGYWFPDWNWKIKMLTSIGLSCTLFGAAAIDLIGFITLIIYLISLFVH